jgi:8-oxo-dGTP pyrophosphatase MutT (NUDIX family)
MSTASPMPEPPVDPPADPLPEPMRRTAGRILLVDDQERVLLIHDRTDVGATSSHWIAPGGGLEPGETPAEAAVREVYEETGLRVRLDPNAQAMYLERARYTFAGQYIDQLNHYYLVRVRSGLPVRPAANTDLEKVVALGHRWWPLGELESAAVVREPTAMVELIRQAIGGEHDDD